MSALPVRATPFRLHVSVAAAVLQQRKGPHRLRCLRQIQACEEQTAQPPEPAPITLETARVCRTVEPGLEFYRKYTQALLRRCMRMSMEGGRAPSLLGRELFSGPIAHCTMHAFDDSVILVHDVDRCLALLDPGLRYLVRRIALEEYTFSETAAMLGINMKTVIRRYYEALDKLTRVLLDRRILQSLMEGLETD